MPYEGERAGKGGHADIFNNPYVNALLRDCTYVKPLNRQHLDDLLAGYQSAPITDWRPEVVFAVDASYYVQGIEEKLPSTQVGYIKTSVVKLDMAEFMALQDTSERFVDPFKAAAMLYKSVESFCFALPGSGLYYHGARSIRESFRRAVWDNLSNAQTDFSAVQDGSATAAQTFLLIEGGRTHMQVCPESECGHRPEGGFVCTVETPVQRCPECGTEVFATDRLYLHDQVNEGAGLAEAVGCFMNVAEQLIVATLIRTLARRDPAYLAKSAFILDGPLAVFGRSAWLSHGLNKLYYGISRHLEKHNLSMPPIFGVQKTGAVMDHAVALAAHLPDDHVRVVDDAYRNRHIATVPNANFGFRTYFGQDFIYKTKRNKVFVFGLPYLLPEKADTAEFAQRKVQLAHYGESLARVCALVRDFQFSLYPNALIPIVMAHRNASISQAPGGKVLDLLTQMAVPPGPA